MFGLWASLEAADGIGLARALVASTEVAKSTSIELFVFICDLVWVDNESILDVVKD